ncbi:MAG TPA: MFS transporter [Tangfeifania sp.]|nr:MFS transporter [Tangfeifania sp.]
MKIKAASDNIPFNPAKVPFFYGWVILFAATVGVLVSAPGQTMGVSTFTDYLIDAIGVNRNQISTAYMIGTIGSSFVLTWAGRQYDKFGARWTAMAASLLLAFVLVLLSQSDRLIELIVSDSESTIFAGVAIASMTFFFFMLRFSGQGVLTMVSRNMLMKWFEARRGLVNGISSVFIAVGFSLAPLTFDGIIQTTSWRMAWLMMAVAIGIFFTLFVFIFFRDNPEDVGMIPDGEKHGNRQHNVTIKPVRQFTLGEARGKLTFWLYALPLAIFALYITGFTFHLVSIFDSVDMDRDKALAVFIPVSFISVGLSFFGGWISDRIHLKYLLYLVLAGELIALFSLANLNDGIFYYGFILGHGITSGMQNVLMTVTWPRFFGRKHLGSITGFMMSLIVFSSALGPVLFSFSFTKLGSYGYAVFILIALVAGLFILAHKGNNPQDKFEIDKGND